MRLLTRTHRHAPYRSFAAVLTVALALTAVPGIARAQFAVTSIEFYDPDPSPDRTLTDQDLKNEYFSRANCECGKSIRLRLRITQNRQSTDRFIVVAGSGTCLNTTDGSILTDTCRVLKEGRIDEQDRDIEITTTDDGVTVSTLMVDDCTTDQELNIYVFTGQDGSWTQGFTTTFTADGTAPTAPTADGDPVAGEELVEVSFTTGSTSQTDVRYQILCEVASTGAPGFQNAPTAGFTQCLAPVTPSDAGVDVGADAGADGGESNGGEASDDGGAATDGGPEAGASDAGIDLGADSAAADTATTDLSADLGTSADTGSSGGISGLDPAYVCSGVLQGDGNAKITGLENGVNYRFYVVAFDLHGNATGAVLLGEATPILSVDLWELYKRSGGKAEGGYCSTAGPVGAGWLGVSLLSLVLLVGLGRKRSGGRR
jgi:hypothetical protein